MFFPQAWASLSSFLNVFLVGWVIIFFFFSVFCRFHGPWSSRLVIIPTLFGSHRLVQILAVIIQCFPFLSFDSLVNGLTKKTHQSASTSGGPQRWSSESAPCTHFFGAQRQFFSSFSGDRLWKMWLYNLDRFGALAWAAHLYSFVIVHFDELPWPIQNTFATLLPQT